MELKEARNIANSLRGNPMVDNSSCHTIILDDRITELERDNEQLRQDIPQSGDQLREINPELYNRIYGDLPNRFRLRRELDNLFDEIVDNIIRTSDEDILEEVREDYGDPSFLANKCRQMLELVKAKAKEK